MSIKRKLIKKARNLNKLTKQIQQTQIQSSQSILQKLKSPIPSIKQQAIIILANIHCPITELYEGEFLREIINILYMSNNSLVYETIFCMSNLCEIQPKMINLLFQNGLDKALIQLKSTDTQLLKPILIFFITITQNIPKKYHYLLHGVQQSLTTSHLKHNTQLVLQFIFRTKHIRPYHNPMMITSQQLLKQISQIFSSTYNIKQKSYSIAILSIALQNNWNINIQEMLTNYMTQLILCIDMKKQYQMNFSENNKKLNKQSINIEKNYYFIQKLDQENMDDQQMQEDQEELGKLNSNQKKILRKQQLQKKKQKLRFFMNTIQGTQILLQFILDVLQSNQFQQQSQSSQQQQLQQQENQQQKQEQCQKSLNLRNIIIRFIKQNMSIFPKYLCLSSNIVPSTQNIVYLFYHLLTHIDKQLCEDKNNNNNKIQINELIQMSLQTLFKNIQSNQQKQQQKNQLSKQQYQVLIQCLQIGFKILLKNKALSITYQFLSGFSKKYLLSPSIFSSLKYLQMIKPSWLICLQLFSLKFNPQKHNTYINLTQQQNYQIGSILKTLLVSIPYTELQQFRCQVIDTLFDVYSNEKFDHGFVKLNIIGLLEMVLTNSYKSQHNQGKVSGKQRKKQKFINDVLKDIKRFIQYKHKMIQNIK